MSENESGQGAQRNQNNSNSGLLSVACENTEQLMESPTTCIRCLGPRLTKQQDRHERLVKGSRDVTIESKRIICLLHSIVKKEEFSSKLAEANERIQKLIDGPLKTIAMELDAIPSINHSRATKAGYQEYVEARTFLSLIETKVLITYEDILKELTYTITNNDGTEKTVQLVMPLKDYVLGLADLSGEMMRRCINSIHNADTEDCFFACMIVKYLYTGFKGIYKPNKEMKHKRKMIYSNLRKVERTVYHLHLRQIDMSSCGEKQKQETKGFSSLSINN